MVPARGSIIGLNNDIDLVKLGGRGLTLTPAEFRQELARYVISVRVNPKTNVGLGVPRAGTFDQKATRNEKAFTKRLNLPPSK